MKVTVDDLVVMLLSVLVWLWWLVIVWSIFAIVAAVIR